MPPLKLETLSDYAEYVLYLDGNPFSLSNGYDLYKDIYNGSWGTLLLKNARQTGKTQTLANFMSLKSLLFPFRRSIYAAPLESQTQKFSHSKLDKVIQGSPPLKALFAKSLVNNVKLKQCTNGSEITLTYCSDDPSRTRGASSDDNIYDEIQDMDLFNVRSVLDSTADASIDPHFFLAGTPLTNENPLEITWQKSSKTEPLIYCDGCKKYNRPTLENIGKKGFICKKCGKLLNVRNFVWRDFSDKYETKGFHIPQIVLPIHTENEAKWKILLQRYEEYPLSKFKNEIMAESDSCGSRFITQEDLYKLCRDYSVTAGMPHHSILSEVDLIVAGVDWSGGGMDGNSRTVLHIWGATPSLRLKTLYYKVYSVEDPTVSVDDIARVCDLFGVRMIIGDAGEGALANGMLTLKLGRHRVGQFRYGSYNTPIGIEAKSGVYQLDKTSIIDNYLKFLKDGGAEFPNALESKVAFDDILSVFSETSHTGRKIYKRNSHSDDCIHAQIGGFIAWRILTRQMQFL